ncbi:MAG: adenylosuccinate lyase [Candidatus Marinimicrobia bacterium]|nr:adenylosuccinate lyase [Candidatus Neomarinimicrobiota bacterium]
MIPRYTPEEIGNIWTEERKFRSWLEVEATVAEVQSERGMIPEEAAKAIREKGNFSVERIEEIEEEVHHDVIAFLTNVAEYVGKEAGYMHFGMTSSDLLDTSLAMRMKEAGELISKELKNLEEVLSKRAVEHKNSIMIGRTHGIHAELITFGLKLSIWVEEIRRHRKRWSAAVDEIATGKISGAVGTYSHLDPEIEAEVCKRLGLKAAPVSNQIVQRDRHANYMTALALISSSLEKFSVEIRHLQRTEVREVQEYFGKGQKGSSAMPHKRNPILSERIAGMSRLVRGNALAAMENVALWHERDISHSSVERVIIPDSTIIVVYCLQKFSSLMENLVVNPERMIENLNQSYNLIYSGGVLLKLVEKNITREEAYAIVQRTAMKAWNDKIDFKQCLLDDDEVNTLLSEKELEGCFKAEESLKQVDGIFERLNLI